MRRVIPSLGALLAFECAARHQSFTKAADELSLTQSAICRRVAHLEEFLGVVLFHRLRRGVRLTDAGVSYRRQVALRMDEIERDALSIMAQRGKGATIELAVMPTFATRWLIPRLDRFYAAQPTTQINLTTQTRPFLFSESGFDASLYFGLAGWPGTEGHLLMHEHSVPVCSPTLLGSRGSLSPEEIAELPLIQQSTRPYAWRDWFRARGISPLHDMTGTRLELFSMSAQAAMLGTGVALIPPILIAEELAAGRLFIANNHSHVDEKAYYLIIPEQNTNVGAIVRFRDWLIDEARDYVATHEGIHV